MAPARKNVARVVRLWDYRREVVEWQLRKLAEVIRQEDADLTRLEEELEGLLRNLEEETRRTPFLEPRELDLFLNGAWRMIREGERKRKALRRLQEEWTAQRRVWEEIEREKKALEILENRLALQEQREASRTEQKRLDDLELLRRRRS